MPAHESNVRVERRSGWKRARRVALLAAGICAGCLGGCAPSALPELTKSVNDFANVVDQQEETRLEETLRQIHLETTNAVVVVTVETIAPMESVQAYSRELFKNHGKGIGQREKDNGLLILLAVAERQVWISPGHGLETIITTAAAEQISQQMVPFFRQGAYGQGLIIGVERVAELMHTTRRQ